MQRVSQLCDRRACVLTIAALYVSCSDMHIAIATRIGDAIRSLRVRNVDVIAGTERALACH